MFSLVAWEDPLKIEHNEFEKAHLRLISMVLQRGRPQNFLGEKKKSCCTQKTGRNNRNRWLMLRENDHEFSTWISIPSWNIKCQDRIKTSERQNIYLSWFPFWEVTRRCISSKKGVWDPGNKSNTRKKQRASRMRHYEQQYTSPKGQPAPVGTGGQRAPGRGSVRKKKE